MKINILIVIAGNRIIGCTCKDEAFNDQKLFVDYADKLNLTDLSPSEAVSRLKIENFKCSNLSINRIFCTRGVPAGCVYGENQNIYLSDKHNNSLEMKTYLQFACL